MKIVQQQIKLNVIEWIALALVIIGGINWGLVGIGSFIGRNMNLVHLALGGIPVIENLVYLLVGVAGIYLIYFASQLSQPGSIEIAEPVDEIPAGK